MSCTPEQEDMRHRVIEHIRFLENHDPAAYNMLSWGTTDNAAECGTSACLAGWTVALNNQKEYARIQNSDNNISMSAVAQELLGLTRSQATYMFHRYAATSDVHEQSFKDIANDPHVDLWQIAEIRRKATHSK